MRAPHGTNPIVPLSLDPDDYPQECAGEWVGGSGGHRQHRGVCHVPPVYGLGTSYAYCEKHVKEHER